MFLTLVAARAEDVLQILPQQIHIGSSSADGRSFSIQMNNEATFTAFQMDLYLPEGMDLDERDPIVLVKDRFPHEEGRYGITFDHEVLFAKRNDGSYRIIVSSNINAQIYGNNGNLLTVYYITDPELPEGIHPVKIKNVVMAISGTEGVRHTETSSFFYTENTDLSSVSSLDFSALTGAVYQDVLNQTNKLIEENKNLSEFNLSGADSISVEPVVQNLNCIYYIQAGSAVAKFLKSVGKNENIVTVSAQGNHCDYLKLTDGYPARFTQPFTATEASYYRRVPTPGWYSLCLPYNSETPENVVIEKFSSLNENTITFSRSEITAHNPRIFYTPETEISFTASNVSVSPAPKELADNSFIGTYQQLSANDVFDCYALHSDGSGFGITGNTTYVPPFRAYVKTEGKSNKIRLIHDNATSISNFVCNPHKIKITKKGNWIQIESDTDAQKIDIYTLDGKYILQCTLNKNENKTISLEKGIYLINNIKITIK